MADIRVTLGETREAIQPLRLLPTVADYCRELFPSDAQITCNNTRVQASFELGENVTASVIIDVDPVYDDPEVTRLSGSVSVSGSGLRDDQDPDVQKLAAEIFGGLKQAVSRAVHGEDRQLDFGLGA